MFQQGYLFIQEAKDRVLFVVKVLKGSNIKPITMKDKVQTPIVTKKAMEAFKSFAEIVDPKEFSRNMRKMFFEYLKIDQVFGSDYYEQLVSDMFDFFDLLDVMEDEIKAEY